MSEPSAKHDIRSSFVEWIADTGDSLPLREILTRLGVEDTCALDGRVFVDRKRTTELETLVGPGARVRVYSPPSHDDIEQRPHIIDRWPGIIAAYKPAGLPTIPDQRGAQFNLLGALRKQLGEAVFTHIQVSSRLDRLVSGVLVFAHDKRAAKALERARRNGTYARHYVAIVSGHLPATEGQITAPIGRASDPRKRKVGGRAPKPASTRYTVVATTAHASLVALELDTGRTHQIRVHMQHMEVPILGDPLYAKRKDVTLPDGTVLPMRRIALHAAWVSIPRGEHLVRVSAPIPPSLLDLWKQLGGADDDWQRAIAALPRKLSSRSQTYTPTT